MRYFLLIIFILVFQNNQAQSILGVDVSHHQNNINWNMVANDGKVFAYCKATEGMTYHDPNFATYMVNGTTAGVVMGAYHFARPDNNTALQDANNFISQAQNYIGDGYLPPALDLENPNSNTHLDNLYTSSQLTNWVQTWLNRVESVTGVKPVIYTNSYYANYLSSSLNSYGLWIAKPGTSPSTPPSNLGHWYNWMFKQYSWYGNVNGISGNVDLNVYHGTVNDFNTMINAVSISQILKNKIRIYPNPVIDKLYIENLSDLKIKQSEIYDLNGRLIQKVEPNTKTVDVGNLHSGMYILKVYLDNESTGFTRFIKQ